MAKKDFFLFFSLLLAFRFTLSLSLSLSPYLFFFSLWLSSVVPLSFYPRIIVQTSNMGIINALNVFNFTLPGAVAVAVAGKIIIQGKCRAEP